MADPWTSACSGRCPSPYPASAWKILAGVIPTASYLFSGRDPAFFFRQRLAGGGVFFFHIRLSLAIKWAMVSCRSTNLFSHPIA